MRYISTRGEAPALGFIDVTLAGLARDGGLYVPDSWPVLTPGQIAALAGRPYAEVACEIVRPFVGGAIPDADLSRMAHDAYGTFRHPAVAPRECWSRASGRRRTYCPRQAATRPRFAPGDIRQSPDR